MFYVGAALCPGRMRFSTTATTSMHSFPVVIAGRTHAMPCWLSCCGSCCRLLGSQLRHSDERTDVPNVYCLLFSGTPIPCAQCVPAWASMSRRVGILTCPQRTPCSSCCSSCRC